MKVAEALRVFGTKSAIADALGIRPPNLNRWGDDVLEKHAPLLVIEAGGDLKPDEADLARWHADIKKKRDEIRVLQKAISIGSGNAGIAPAR